MKIDSKIVIPLILVLIVASFFVGSLWTKFGQLGEEVAKVSPSPQPQQEVQTPTQAKVLGASQMDDLVKGGVVLGASDAKVTVVEFSDPSCPYCAAAAGVDLVVGKDEEGKEVRLISDYLRKNDPDWQAPGPELERLAKEGKIRLVFRYYPGHGTGELAMQAAWCAGDQEQDKFWNFLYLVFVNQAKLEDIEKILQLASKTGLDESQLKACVESDKYKERIQADIQAAREAAKLATGNENFGTPTFFINGRQVVGAQSYEVFAKIIEEELGR